jgi:hypothetical protein
MAINRLLKGSALGPEDVERLNRAYTYALRSLHLVERDDDPVADMVARKIIEIGATVRDPNEISKIAIKRLGVL